MKALVYSEPKKLSLIQYAKGLETVMSGKDSIKVIINP